MEKLRRLKFKELAKQGEVIQIKTLAEHNMETGVRRDPDTGVIYPRLIIQKVTAKYNGVIVFKANWFSGVSANPYLAFFVTAKESGLIEVEWKDDYASVSYKRGYLKVTDKYNKEVLPVEYKI
jgi:sulfur-oxidizing protein SoxZ